MTIRALIADDEPNLLQDLKERLEACWPGLEVCASATNGTEALRMIDEQKPDLAFLDIQMPGQSGLDAVRQMRHRCLVVFVTAYHEYAVEAFERAAIDYVLKPVDDERLRATVRRLQDRLREQDAGQRMDAALSAVERALERKPSYLQYVRAGSRDGISLIPVDDVILFRSKDKYTAVFTREDEYLIRTTIAELAGSLDPSRFWQVHRAAIVNASKIVAARRAEQDRLLLDLKDYGESVAVSRPFLHLFKQM